MEQLGTFAGLLLWGLASILAAQTFIVIYQLLTWAIGRLKVKRAYNKALLKEIKGAYRR